MFYEFRYIFRYIELLHYSGTPLYGHPLYTDSFVCPDKKLICFL